MFEENTQIQGLKLMLSSRVTQTSMARTQGSLSQDIPAAHVHGASQVAWLMYCGSGVACVVGRRGGEVRAFVSHVVDRGRYRAGAEVAGGGGCQQRA